ncbi:MAG: cytochrome b/b6 domain-containing protein [Bacteroidales bacterium]|nr:cytochrome b/b6 domain-containing protein [Bacteroidales bacterium]
MIKNDLTQKFGRGTIWVHWITALLILILVLSSLKIGGFEFVEKSTMTKIHILLGSLVFILTIIRSFLLFKSIQPDSLKTGSKFVDKLAIWNHYLFYVLLFTISISEIVIMFTGYYLEFLSSGNIDDIVKTSSLKYHVLMAFFVILLLIMHAVGVVKHYIFTKENTLKRIL